MSSAKRLLWAITTTSSAKTTLHTIAATTCNCHLQPPLAIATCKYNLQSLLAIITTSITICYHFTTILQVQLATTASKRRVQSPLAIAINRRNLPLSLSITNCAHRQQSPLATTTCNHHLPFEHVRMLDVPLNCAAFAHHMTAAHTNEFIARV